MADYVRKVNRLVGLGYQEYDALFVVSFWGDAMDQVDDECLIIAKNDVVNLSMHLHLNQMDNITPVEIKKIRDPGEYE